MRRMVWWRAVMTWGLALVLALAGCGEGTRSGSDTDVAVSPEAENELPPDIQRVEVTIDGGNFSAARYAVQTGPVQLVVTTRGGPYTLTIGSLVPATELPVDSTTPIGFTAPEAGDYQMTLADGDGMATLNVRQPGTR